MMAHWCHWHSLFLTFPGGESENKWAVDWSGWWPRLEVQYLKTKIIGSTNIKYITQRVLYIQNQYKYIRPILQSYTGQIWFVRYRDLYISYSVWKGMASWSLGGKILLSSVSLRHSLGTLCLAATPRMGRRWRWTSGALTRPSGSTAMLPMRLAGSDQVEYSLYN